MRYDATVDALALDGGVFKAACIGEVCIPVKAYVLACGRFESNRDCLRDAWGQNAAGEWPAENFLIRGTPFNKGVLLKQLPKQGADRIGELTQSHCVASLQTASDALTLRYLDGDLGQRPMDLGLFELLLAIGATGLLLVILRDIDAMAFWLALHLGCVMVLFITMPYGKFSRGIYRCAAFLKNVPDKRTAAPS